MKWGGAWSGPGLAGSDDLRWNWIPRPPGRFCPGKIKIQKSPMKSKLHALAFATGAHRQTRGIVFGKAPKPAQKSSCVLGITEGREVFRARSRCPRWTAIGPACRRRCRASSAHPTHRPNNCPSRARPLRARERQRGNRRLDFSNCAPAGKLSPMRFGVNAAKLFQPL